ncbi:MAG: ABC transporter ATP-binding protein [Vulcanimicrobiaceae bacterium]
MLEVRGLDIRYGDIAAVKGIDLRVETGEIVALIGANGAGKTTTLRAIAGALRASAGEIRFDGHALNVRVPPHRRARLGLVLVPEGRGILGRMNVEENLQMGAFPRRRVPAREMHDVYERFPALHAKRKLSAALLSGGEQQMLAIGRALLAAPRLLMLDEPSLGLSPLMVRTIFKVIDELHRAGMTIVMVEQKAYQTLTLAQRVYVMETGRIVAEGTAAELARSSVLSDAFLGAAPPQASATS